MLENGMVVNQERYDPQCKPYVCDHCGEIARHYTAFRSGDLICDDCLYEYVRQIGGDYVEDFVEDHMDEYVGQWFDGLEPNERLTAILTLYRLYRQWKPGQAAQDRAEFAMEHIYFPEYVRKREAV